MLSRGGWESGEEDWEADWATGEVCGDMAGIRSSLEDDRGLSPLLLLLGEVGNTPSGSAEPPLWWCIHSGTAELEEVEDVEVEEELEAEWEVDSIEVELLSGGTGGG